MNTYWLSFVVRDQANRDERYRDLIAAVESCRQGTYWNETTSFIVFESGYDIDAVADALAHTLRVDLDIFLLHQVGFKTARIWGAVTDGDIYNLMPHLVLKTD